MLLKTISAKERGRTTKAMSCSSIGITLLNKILFYFSYCADHCDPKCGGT